MLSGVANAFIPAIALDTPLTYEAMRDAGSGLGAAGFIVIDDRTDLRRRRARRRALPRGRVVRAVHAVQARRSRDRRASSTRSGVPRRRTVDVDAVADRAVDRRRQRAVHAREPAADRGRAACSSYSPTRVRGHVESTCPRRSRIWSRRSSRSRTDGPCSTSTTPAEAARLDLQRDRLGQVAGAAHQRTARGIPRGLIARSGSVGRRDSGPLVEARALTKRFGSFVAVDGIDFAIEPGEAFGFLGPNGAGKSSTMRMIGCVSPISSGELRVLGLDPSDSTARRSAAASASCRRRTTSTPSSRSGTTCMIYGRYFDLPRAEIRRARRGAARVRAADRPARLARSIRSRAA